MELRSYTLRKFFIPLMLILAILLVYTPVKAMAGEKILKIGILGPMRYIAGKHQYWGAQLSAEEINETGGVKVGKDNYKIELIKKDSNELSSVVDAVNGMEKLITRDKCRFILGTFRSEATLAQQEIMADNKVIFIGIGSASPRMTMRVAKEYDRYKYYFRTQPVNAANQVALTLQILHKTADALRKALGIKTVKVALLFEKAAWTEPMIKIAKAKLPKMGMEVIGLWQPSPMATDVTAELSGIKSAGAHMIFEITSGPVGAVLARQWGELQIPAALSGINVQALQKSQWDATDGKCQYETMMGFHARAAITDKTIPFYDKFLERFSQFPSFSSGNDAIYVLKNAIERAGTLDTDAVVSAMEKTDYQGTIGRIAFYPKGHKWQHDVIYGPGYVTGLGLQWINGEHKVIWPDGKTYFGDERFAKIKYPGTVDYKIPPWVIEYWKNKK